MRFLVNTVLATALLALPALAGPPLIRPAAKPAPSAVPAIPEPAALALFVLGAGVVGVAIRRRQS
jgi:PEP-CTERM motif